MGSKPRIALTVALVAILVVVLLLVADPDESGAVTPPLPPAAPAADAGAEVRGPGAASPAADEEEGRTPVAVATEAEEVDPLLEPEDGVPYHVEFRVVDGFGLSVPGAEVHAAPLGLPLNDLGRTGPDGRLAVRWYGRTGSMELAWSVRQGGRTSPLFRSLLFAEEERRLLALHENPVVALRGQVSVNLVVRGVMHTQNGLQIISGTAGVPEVVRRETGEIGFVDPLDWGGQGLLRGQIVSGSGSRLLLEYRPALVDLSVVQSADVPPPATMRGVVRNGAGEPLPHVPVTAGPDDEVVRARTETDEHGAFVLEELPTPWCVVRAGGGPFGLAVHGLGVDPGDELEWEPTLDRGLELTGRLLTVDDTPLASWRIEVVDDDPGAPWRAGGTTAIDGSFAIPNCPRGGLRLECYANGSTQRFPRLVVDGLRAGAPPGEYRVEHPQRLTGLVLTVRDENDEVLPQATVRLWHPRSGRGARLTHAGESGHHSIQFLPPGEFVVEAGAERRGWIEQRGVFLEGGDGAIDLGELGLPALGAELARLELRFTPPRPWRDDDTGATLHRLDPTVAAQVLALPADTGETSAWLSDVQRMMGGEETALAIPPGEYVLRLHHGEHGTHDYPFAVAPGGSLALDVTVRADELRVEEVTAPPPAADED